MADNTQAAAAETPEIENKTALVIVAHPDDAEFGCGGTIARWVGEGWRIVLVVSTDASGGGADDAEDVGPAARKAITETRKREQLAAAKVLGIEQVIFLDMPDGRLEPTLEFRRELVRWMRTVKPYRLLCQSPERSWSPQYRIGRHHPDHLATGAAAMMAMYPAAQNGWDFPELLAEGLKPHKIKELYVMGAPVTNHAIDISTTFDTKIAALRAHDSQLGARFDEVEKLMREWSGTFGAPFGLECAEVFHKTEN
jgi:LmbE family N-acetylglucosaminyl deacetylase